MREKIVQIVVVLSAFLIGILGTLYFSNNGTIQTSLNSNIKIKEEGSISASVQKIYNSVVVVESFSNGKQAGSGSGFVYKKEGNSGYVLTNYHVVDGATNLKIVTMDGNEVDATYLGGDSYADIAVLKMSGKAVLDVANIGDSTKSLVGDTVFTVGTPIGSEYMGTVTKGILSGSNRTITVNDGSGAGYMMEVLQTDASINPGNSGGPLVNINGEVIGITSMKLVTDEIEGMGFAIPIEIALAQISGLESGKNVQRPYIGISLYDVTNTAMLYRYGITVDSNLDYGVVVASVEENSDADKAGLKSGDIILTADGDKIKSTAHFKFLLYKHNIGDTIRLHIKRSGKDKDLTLKLKNTLNNSGN